MLMPPSLKKGEKIAFISPASIVKEEYVEGAMELVRRRGYQPILMPHALGPADGSYSSSIRGRLNDILSALEEDEIKAIFTTRGGYGCVQMLPDIPGNLISSHPKWIVGFSDVSALLALWYVNGVASIHGPMAKHLATMPFDDPCTESLFNILENDGRFNYHFVSSKYNNHQGYARGTLRGGNMAVLNGLAATPYDIFTTKPEEDIILFFEDINEPIYAIERMLWRLSLSGMLDGVKGIIFGRFTEYKPDKNFKSMEDMIDVRFRDGFLQDIPVAFDFPIGHVDFNYPVVEGAKVELVVTAQEVSLKTL